MTYLLGIDLGTSSVKVAIVDAATLQVVASTGYEYPIDHPAPGFAEQDPAGWWEAVVQAVRSALGDSDVSASDIAGIGVAGQMHGLVCLGADHQPVHPAIIWADSRATTEVEELAAFQESSTVTLPGPPAAGFAGPSALWLSRHRPDVLAQTAWCLLPKDYVRFRLTGQIHSEPSGAGSTWLFDIAEATWAPAVVERCGLHMAQMPPICDSTDVCGTVTPDAASALGVAAGIPVVAGSADLPAQALGHGIIRPETVFVTVGTGGQVFRPLLSPQIDRGAGIYVYPHNVPGRWYAQAAILAGGLSLRWLRDLLGMQGKTDAYAHLSLLAGEIDPGAEGLLFLPYLAGERTPHMDPHASGLFLGLRLHHEAAHLARAVMEGVAFALKGCFALIASEPAEVLVSGGITRSEVWCQIVADVWNQPLRLVPAETPRACLGAAILAGIGTGIYVDVADATSRLSEPTTIVYPQTPERYAKRYEQYRSLYPLLSEMMHALRAG